MLDSLLEPHFQLEVKRVNITVSRVIGVTLRVAQVSDMHFPSLLSPVYDRAIIAVRDCKPDIVVVTGDLVSTAKGVGQACEFVGALSEAAPALVVWGNWDYWALGQSLAEFRSKLQRAGDVRVLVNEALRTDTGVWIVGLDDPHTGRANAKRALSGLGDEHCIALAHSPQAVGLLKGRTCCLLAGHTHGGQVVLPLIGPPFVPLSRKYRHLVAGLYEEYGVKIYVNRGLGTTGLPVRLLCPPEVTILDIAL